MSNLFTKKKQRGTKRVKREERIKRPKKILKIDKGEKDDIPSNFVEEKRPIDEPKKLTFREKKEKRKEERKQKITERRAFRKEKIETRKYPKIYKQDQKTKRVEIRQGARVETAQERQSTFKLVGSLGVMSVALIGGVILFAVLKR